MMSKGRIKSHLQEGVERAGDVNGARTALLERHPDQQDV